MTKLDQILYASVEHASSDVHLTAGAPPMYRINKSLVRFEDTPLSGTDISEMIYPILSDEQLKHFKQKLEIDFSYTLGDDIRFRVNVYMQRGTVASAFRRIPIDIPDLDTLGVPKISHKLLQEEQGFVIITGATGQGKSTTLASMIEEINTKFPKHIITIEDPIEYLFTHKQTMIAQREIGSDAISFSSALRSILREDPDVILVGEMRDLDTISTSLNAAETGHLVFATLHTSSSAQAVNRIVDMFPASQQEQIKLQLSSVLIATMAQQLIKKADGSGLALATEVMTATPAIRSLIREGKTHIIPSTIQISAKDGMQTMEQSLKNLILSGVITYDEAMKHAFIKDDLARLIKEH